MSDYPIEEKALLLPKTTYILFLYFTSQEIINYLDKFVPFVHEKKRFLLYFPKSRFFMSSITKNSCSILITCYLIKYIRIIASKRFY